MESTQRAPRRAAQSSTVITLQSSSVHFSSGWFPLNVATGTELATPASSLASTPTTAIAVERKALVREMLAEVRRLDRELAAHCERISAAVTASATTLTQLYGVGPIVAAYVIGHSGDICRFPSAGHYARYNATAPIEASSGPKTRHRLNPNGNRQLNHAIHVAALGQISHDTPGRAYYLQKQTDGKSRKEAMRALKRRISDAVYRQLVIDSHR